MDEAVGREHAPRDVSIIGIVPGGIAGNRLERKWEATVGVDLADCQRAVAHGSADRRVRPGRRKQQSNANNAVFDHADAQ
jgi:hypothetical protein